MTACRTIFSVALLLCFAVKGNAQEFLKQTRIDSIAVPFKNASSDIGQQAQLLERLKKIDGKGTMKVVLKAYTDTVGTLESNKALASQRMLAAWKLVKASSLASVRIDTLNLNEKRIGKRVEDPLYRRVDILVYELEPEFAYGEKVNLRIQFESGTARILPSSIASVEKLLLLMQMDTSLSIELHGHVCCSPDQLLSFQRAQSVQSYLMRKGIPGSRMTCRGFSNTQPVARETSEGEKARNRRVEVLFVDKRTVPQK